MKVSVNIMLFSKKLFSNIPKNINKLKQSLKIYNMDSLSSSDISLKSNSKLNEKSLYKKSTFQINKYKTNENMNLRQNDKSEITPINVNENSIDRNERNEKKSEKSIKKKVDFGKIISMPAKKHIVNLLLEYENKNVPLDTHLRKYFSKHKMIPEKEFISNQCYFLMRNKLLLDVISIPSTKKEITWEQRYNSYYNKDFFLKQKDNVNIPL